MAGCILHIGMHKTGSTSIQRALHAHLSGSRQRYAALGRPNHSAVLAAAFMEEPSRYHMHRKLGLDAAGVAQRVLDSRQLLERAFAQDADVHVLSGEAVSALSGRELSSLRDWLERRVDTIHVIGYVRPLRSYIESSWQQRIRGGSDRFEASIYPRYGSRFSLVDDVFGASRVMLHKYSPATLRHGCVVRDFCAVAGLALEPGVAMRVNRSLSLPALALLFTYRRCGPGFGVGAEACRANNRLLRCLETLQGSRMRVPVAAARLLAEGNRPDLDWMEDRLGASLRDGLDEDDGQGVIGRPEQLFESAVAARGWLAEQLAGSWSARARVARTPGEIAACVHALRDSLAARDPDPELARRGPAARAVAP